MIRRELVFCVNAENEIPVELFAKSGLFEALHFNDHFLVALTGRRTTRWLVVRHETA